MISTTAAEVALDIKLLKLRDKFGKQALSFSSLGLWNAILIEDAKALDQLAVVGPVLLRQNTIPKTRPIHKEQVKVLHSLVPTVHVFGRVATEAIK